MSKPKRVCENCRNGMVITAYTYSKWLICDKHDWRVDNYSHHTCDDFKRQKKDKKKKKKNEWKKQE